jgi:signal transduction histidine kinase
VATAAPPRRFRRRLIAAFVLVVAATGGVLVLSSYLAIRQHRFASFAALAEEEARLSMLSVPPELTLPAFEALLAEYQERGGFDTVAVTNDVAFSSYPELSLADVPTRTSGADALVRADAEVDGVPYLVLGGVPMGSSAELYFFFSRAELLGGIREFGAVLAIAWLASVAFAAIFGERVARRTLRPVAAAARASRSLAEGLLETRLDPGPDDEFGAWAASFNRMAQALEENMGALARAAERERRFTADVAHELRTPVAGMASAASLLEAELDAVGPPARRPAQILIDDARRLRSLVLELLELARHDAGQEQVNLEPLRLTEAIAAVVRAHGGGANIEVAVDEELCVVADRARFRRVLDNLVGNALQHGEGAVTVAAGVDGEEVVLEVLDRGPGIDPAVLPHVFERFFKADASRAPHGSGLGLSIALVNAHLQHGTLEVANREGGGARFTFRLPHCDEPEADDSWSPG